MAAYPEDEGSKRLERVKKGMENRGVDVLMAYSAQWKLETVHYLSNYRLLGVSACVVLSADADPVLYISSGGDYKRAAATSWIRDIRVFDGEDITGALSYAKSHGRRRAVAGLEILSAGQYESVLRNLGEGIDNGAAVIDDAARIKSEWEIGLLEEGGRLADMGFLAEMASIRRGLKEYELAADIDYAMRAAGADDNFQMLAAGKRLSCMHVPREQRVESGDLIISEITPMKFCVTYAVQLCRTAKLGRATGVERDKYMLLAEALEESLSLIRPGVSAGEIAKAQNRIIASQGYGEYCRPPFMRSRGHNFGLGQFELTEDNDMELKAGMAMVVHPNQFLPETGYLACGESVVVSGSGARRLSSLPTRLYEVDEMAR